MKNNLYTKSYFIKRLKDNGYNSNTLLVYPTSDIRKWTINISPPEYNILCTCYKESLTEFWFSFQCQQNSKLTLKTLSMKSVFEMVDNLIDGHKMYESLKVDNG